jgi:uncharacterized protein YigE (DUF2233 family)
MARALLAFLALWLVNTAAQAACAPKTFEENRYIVCSFDAAKDRLALFNLDASGQPYGTFAALDQALHANGKSLAFAMNAGMFDENLKPIGLYVEAGRPLKKINRKDGGGNFHLKPNGVFYIAGAQAGVLETEAFVKAGMTPGYATQSGPMLVIDGEIHPKFTEGSTSYKRRNGVGSINGHNMVFAISEDAVTFYDFARLFRNGLGCRNALFLDGQVSSLYAPELGRDDAFVSLGPMVGLAK